jgi:amino acid transporter
MKNKFGFLSLVLLGINGIIGSGIFLLPNVVAGLVGNASLWVILFCTVLVMILALCFAEMASLFSRNGGAYLYATAAFGGFVGFEVGIMQWAIVITSWAALTVAFAQVLGASVPFLSGPIATKLVICVTLSALAFINIRGVNLTKYVNNVVTIGKLIPIAFLILLGVFFIEPAQIVPAVPELSDGSFASAVLIMFFAFSGFAGISLAASDIDNPQKNIPRAIVLVMIIVAIIYLLIQMVVTGVLGADKLAASGAPLADAAKVFAGEFGYQLIMIGSCISIFGITVSVSFIAPRLGVALAEDRLLPPFVAKMSRFDTPMWSILIVTGLALTLALSGSFAKIVAINVVARLTVYGPLCLAVLVLRRTMADQYTGFRIPFGPVVPVLGLGVCVWLLANSATEKLMLGSGALVIGAVLYLFMLWKNGESDVIPEVLESTSK